MQFLKHKFPKDRFKLIFFQNDDSLFVKVGFKSHFKYQLILTIIKHLNTYRERGL